MSGNEDFFGGSPTPASGVPFSPPTNPYAAPNREYGNYGGIPAPVAKNSGSQLALIVGAIVIALVGALAFAGYRVAFGGTQIEIPDTLMGMDRTDPNSPAGQSLKQFDQWNPATADVDMQLALFQSSRGQTLFVMAGEAGTGDSDFGASDFFAGFESGMTQSGSTLSLVSADPGPNGGQMKCLEGPTGDACVWISEDTFGMFAMAPFEGDPADTAHQIREAIER